MNAVQIFEKSEFGQVRIQMDANNEPLFCLVDVCRVLDLQPSRVKDRLDDGVISSNPIVDNLGRIQQALFVNEDGLYDVILDSRKPQAKAFRKWVTSEVLPSIRKHGAYATETTIDSIIANPENGIRLLQALQQEREEKRLLEADNEAKQREIDAARPAVTFTSAVSGAESSCLIGELAKIIAQNGVEIGEKRLFQWLRDNGYLGRHGERYNVPNQKYIEQGLFTVKKGVRSGSGGVLHTTLTPKITGKGQVYFVNKFLNSVAL